MHITMKQAVTGVALIFAFLLSFLWGPFFWLGLAGLAVVVYRHAWVMIPEWHVGVVYSRERQAFARLLPAGRHFIWPGAEQLAATFTTIGHSAQATTSAQTCGGLAVKMNGPLLMAWSQNGYRPPNNPN